MKATSHIQVPPEWDLQTAVWAGWPTLEEEWGEAFEPARAEIARFAETLARFVPVRIAAGSEEAAVSAKKLCGAFAEIHQIPLGDVWLRDTGPIIARAGNDRTALRFRFDGWGGKYLMPGDTETGHAIARIENLPVSENAFVLEGGAVEFDGAGNLITTRQCLLDGVRNPDWNEAAAEQALKNALGVSTIVWATRGLLNDHTDGHVDNIARFVAPGHAVCQRPSGSDDPHAEIMAEIEAELRASGLKVTTIPSPGRIEIAGDVMPASHLNFLITNGAVIMPAFDDTHSTAACAALADLFPGREVIAMSARNILAGGGTFHCMTREVPAKPKPEPTS